MSDCNYAELVIMGARRNFENFPAKLHVGERALDFALEDLAREKACS